jgi:hypothetical protein
MKKGLWFIAVIIVGALLGSFIGKFIGIVVPAGSIRDLFATEISAGLSPTNLNLRVIDLTFGLLFKFNITSIIGIALAAYLFKKVVK